MIFKVIQGQGQGHRAFKYLTFSWLCLSDSSKDDPTPAQGNFLCRTFNERVIVSEVLCVFIVVGV